MIKGKYGMMVIKLKTGIKEAPLLKKGLETLFL